MMKNYKPIGDFIRLVDERNKGLQVKQLLGLSISKEFIPSVANIIGTDMENYKIIRKKQFACSIMQVSRDKKMPIALLQEIDEAIISQAYPVFEVKDDNELLPEYLMMWFTRSKFDRETCFYAVGGVRGSLEWEDFENMKIPIPSIAKQKEIVKEYNVIQNRININQQLIQKLEETAQAIYKHWFVEFEFPDKNGKPYKSNGGEMEWNEELEQEVPKGWEVGKLSDIATIIMGQSPDGETYNKVGKGMIFYQGRTDFGYRYPNITTYTTKPKKKALKNDILISVRAPVGDLNIAIENCCIGRGVGAIRSKLKNNSHLFYLLQKMKSHFDISDEEGTIFGSINKDDLHNTEVIYSLSEIRKFEKITSFIDIAIKNYCIENKKLLELKELLLMKLTKI
ncbi:MAG: restriction endonuclease subunit S [Sediminibacterium sp.]|nr:restriction endonuclease subunit S [Sediminibacterium sp.]